MAVSSLKIPLLFLDTMGTIFMAARFCTGWGFLVSIGTHFIIVLLDWFSAFPFVLVSIATAIIVGLIAKNGKFGLGKAIVAGLLLSIVSPLIGTPIRLLLFGGFTGSGTDVLIAGLRASGSEIFASTFIGVVASNFVDKIVSCILVSVLINKLPKNNFGAK